MKGVGENLRDSVDLSFGIFEVPQERQSIVEIVPHALAGCLQVRANRQDADIIVS